MLVNYTNEQYLIDRLNNEIARTKELSEQLVKSARYRDKYHAKRKEIISLKQKLKRADEALKLQKHINKNIKREIIKGLKQ